MFAFMVVKGLGSKRGGNERFSRFQLLSIFAQRACDSCEFARCIIFCFSILWLGILQIVLFYCRCLVASGAAVGGHLASILKHPADLRGEPTVHPHLLCGVLFQRDFWCSFWVE